MSKGHKIINIFAKNESLRDVVVFAICLIAGLIFGSAINVASSAGAESYIDTTSASIASESIKNYDQKSTIEKVELAAIQTKNEYTEPKVSTGAGILYMPSINLYRGISYVSKGTDPQKVIDSGAIAAYNGNVLLAHNPGSFSGLVNIYNSFASGANITFNYNGRDYTVYDAEIAAHNGKQYITKYGNRSLNRLSESNTLTLVTCYGNNQRIIIYAK